MSDKDKKLQIRNSTAEFLVFTKQAGGDSIEVRIEGDTVWLTHKSIVKLFEKGSSSITDSHKIFEGADRESYRGDKNSVCRDFRHAAIIW